MIASAPFSFNGNGFVTLTRRTQRWSRMVPAKGLILLRRDA